MNDLLQSLTDAQRAAVEHIDGPLLILAGPGSGKTRVVTHRIANLLRHGVPGRHILALTFTNKAAEEMRRRVETLAPGQRVWISTFHKFCARVLREHAQLVGLSENFTIYDTSDSLQVLKREIEALDVAITHYTPERIHSAISWAKNNLVTAEQYQGRPGDPLGAIVAKLYPGYQRRLLESNAVDFDDLLLHIATLLRENPEVRSKLDHRYRYILVDEYQDTNLAQYMIVRALSLDFPNLAATGDPDQSIYGWRGANLNNILEFDRDYPEVEVVRLEQNYRSTKRILRVADQLITNNKRRKEKRLFTENAEGQLPRMAHYATQRDEAEAIAGRIAADVAAGRRRPRDFAVFYRINALSRTFEFAMREFGIPYQIVNGLEFFQRKEIKDVLAYLRLLNNPADNVAFARVINTPPRGIGKSTLLHISTFAEERGISWLAAARQCGNIKALKGRAVAAVGKFTAIVDKLEPVAAESVEEVMGHVLAESGYQDFLRESDAEEDQERLANIEELLTAAREFDEQNPDPGALEAFLEQSCLASDTDAFESEVDRVTLMTMHAAKGLEFPVVFVTAVEEGLLPHERSQQHPEQLEEERRLLFVGITRAQEELQLSVAKYREFRGQRRMTVPSQFLMELPREEMELIDVPAPAMSWHPGTWPGAAQLAGLDEVALEAMADRWRSASEEDLPFEVPVATPATSAPQSLTSIAGRLKTASEMLAPGDSRPATPRPPIDPDTFHQGMAVIHPEYGLGKIIACSGSQSKRTATVSFASVPGEKRFILVHSPLIPAQLKSS